MKTLGSVSSTWSSPDRSVGGCAVKVTLATCGWLWGALSDGSVWILMVPLLPGGPAGLGVAAPAICGIAKPPAMSIAVSRPTSAMARLVLFLFRILGLQPSHRLPLHVPRPSGTARPRKVAVGFQNRTAKVKQDTDSDLGKCDFIA